MGLFNDEKYAPIRPNRIGEQLPYFEFEENERSPLWRAHVLHDGRLGMCWKTTVPPSYSHDNGHMQTINELRTLVESLPFGYEMQLIITSHNDLTDRMRQYLSMDSGLDRGRLLRQARAEKLLESGFNGYQVAENGYSMLRDTYLVITLKSPEQTTKLGIFKHLIDSTYQLLATLLSSITDVSRFLDKFLNDTVKQAVSEFQETVLVTENTLNDMFAITRDNRMDLVDLKKHYWTAYTPSFKEIGQKVKIDPSLPFNDQLFCVPIEHDHDYVKLGNDYHTTIMLAMMPDTVGPDYLGIMRRILPTQYTFFCNIAQANQMYEKTALSVQAELRRRVSNMFNKEEAAAYGQEASEVKTRMFGGRKINYIMLGVMIHGYSKEDLEEKALRVNSAFKKLSVIPDIERSMALQAFSYSWPLVWSNEYTRPFARTRRVLSDDMTDLLPMHGHWAGTKAPQAVYVNRDGELTFFDHTSNDFVNWHYAITGTSGSGKSFAVVDLVLQLFAAGVERQFLMTIKDDYDRFAETMGRSIVIDLDSQSSCINPFAGKITKHRLQQWSAALELMLRKGSDFDAGRSEQRLVEQIVQYAYELVPPGDVLRPTWIREAFYKFPYVSEEQRTIGMQDAEEIGSYCKDGIYGRLFDGFPSITEKDRLVVFNLQGVLAEKISDVIVNAIFTMLDNVMYLGDRAAKKHLLVDEMISMVSSKGGGQVASQLKRAFRTYRSLNCMCGIASQNEEDLTTEVGQAIIGNITKRMILKPRREMIPMLMQSLGLRSERHEANIASLETRPGFYSEFYLMSPLGEVVCRLLSDRLTYALATTTPDDVAEIKRIKEERSLDWWNATVEFSKMYPNGVRAAKAAATRAANRGK